MNQQQFEQLKSSYNLIPLAREVFADLDTPLSVYLKLANNPYSYLFESVQGGEKWGRYSIIGLGCRTRLKVFGHDVTLETDDQVIDQQAVDDPLQYIENYLESFKVAELDCLPRFNGGLVGYFGYDTIRYIEPKLKNCPNPDKHNTPDILLMLSEELVVFDNLASRLYIIVYADPNLPEAYKNGQQKLDELVEKIQQCQLDLPAEEHKGQIDETDFESEFTREGYMQAVDKARQYIIDGDAMQIVLSQRLSIPFKSEPLNLYRALRGLNPSPYMYYLNLGDHYVVGSSPEILVRLEEGEVTVRPIAGTRPRGHTPTEDKRLEQELLSDPKELAEHLMLIDLGRNDAGRVSKTGTVKLTDKMIVEHYSHVMHIVSNVEGELKPDMSAMDVLRATFPAGTVSGAPKIRAMEIIDELEPVKRGIYSGAVGYLSWSGNMDTAIAIRTAVIKDKKLYIQAGAGIVYDSVAENEWAETMNKARAIFRAVALAESGLSPHDPCEQEEEAKS
ncbi:MAG: anthranilate synthase component I [Gammaproteobacteria bacterium]|jgi:anthranilate synthase component 1|nr:anthranilate synthase component I [Gammaproteobacteria bacterium]MBT3723640.1 anthranilate synthase component I [Gammaproteobacteria bacterium]MBT4077364.1 anthranilate synthase component I [Gammaproteobacteria bacterium]MBT4194101.1 anthranilate synthase component I [Gammaproteobacteria bacterium]MBT4451413.1 anthranilate synthase component I [Gammaproteobacteria bacterium]